MIDFVTTYSVNGIALNLNQKNRLSASILIEIYGTTLLRVKCREKDFKETLTSGNIECEKSGTFLCECEPLIFSVSLSSVSNGNKRWNWFDV